MNYVRIILIKMVWKLTYFTKHVFLHITGSRICSKSYQVSPHKILYHCNNEYSTGTCDWVYLKCPTFTVSNGCPVTTPTEPVRGNILKSTHHPFVNISLIYEYLSVNISFILFYEYLSIKISFISQCISHLWTFISQLIYLKKKFQKST